MLSIEVGVGAVRVSDKAHHIASEPHQKIRQRPQKLKGHLISITPKQVRPSRKLGDVDKGHPTENLLFADI